jgi:hypothetical protein
LDRRRQLTALQKRWLKRRQAIEPMIGHTKSDHRMDRCSRVRHQKPISSEFLAPAPM